jgi:hypothetical protein
MLEVFFGVFQTRRRDGNNQECRYYHDNQPIPPRQADGEVPVTRSLSCRRRDAVCRMTRNSNRQRFGWHAQTNGMGVVSATTTPFAKPQGVPPTDPLTTKHGAGHAEADDIQFPPSGLLPGMG